MSERKITQLKALVKGHFNMPIKFVQQHQMMKSIFSYTKTINLVKIDVTPCGDHLLVCINS